MRVHGDKVIRRRDGISKLSDYQSAKEILKQDFYDLCGYCGKNSKHMHQHFQIDHFVPKSLDSKREKDYYNLVLACPRCNRAKWNQWPTRDVNVPNDGNVGFVDPATPEFDEHIQREANGFIVGITPLGRNMCHMLQLDIRPTNLLWKIDKFCEQQEKLEECFWQGTLSNKEKEFYIKNNIFLKSYISKAMAEGE